MYIAVFLFSVFISSLSQVILKMSANKEYKNILQEYLNPRIIVAYGLFFASTLITIMAYKYVNLSLGAVLESSGYIFVTVLSGLILNEKINKQKIFGLLTVLVGIFVFNL